MFGSDVIYVFQFPQWRYCHFYRESNLIQKACFEIYIADDSHISRRGLEIGKKV